MKLWRGSVSCDRGQVWTPRRWWVVGRGRYLTVSEYLRHPIQSWRFLHGGGGFWL